MTLDYKRARVRLDIAGHDALMTPDVARVLAHALRKAANDLERGSGALWPGEDLRRRRGAKRRGGGR